jgi:deazaflavin-dependent oxidoreductase (nitroreductase family)
MTADHLEQTPKLPPRLFVRIAWVLHRAIYRFTGGRRGLWRPKAGGTYGTMRLKTLGKRWNPIFAVIEHRGRRTGRRYATPVAARRTASGFVISLAFGAQADWYRNLLAAGGGVIRWRGHAYRVTVPERIAVATGLAAFHPLQRVLLRIAGVDGYVQVRDMDSGDT